MKFGDVKVPNAKGAVLAHSLKVRDSKIAKGAVLTEEHLALLKDAGVETIIAARGEPGDVYENEAARRLATALAQSGLECSLAATGRVNLHATEDGLLVLSAQKIEQINLMDERVTIATLPPHAPLVAGSLAATVKVISYFVPESLLDRAVQVGPALRLAPFRPLRTGLIVSLPEGGDTKLAQKGRRATGGRLERYGGKLARDITVAHNQKDIAAALKNFQKDKQKGLDLILVLGASAIADRKDIVPMALEEAGGTIEHLGMPVDPGNLLLLGRLGKARVIGVPGCARSPKLNGFDMVLDRLHAGLDVLPEDIAKMGVGGLLKEIPSRPQPRETPIADKAKTPRKVAALVLAAGRSRRMGPQNKLTAPLDGKPLVRHIAEALARTSVKGPYVVTGYQKEDVERALEGCQARFIHNADYASGLSSSLKAGLAALPDDIDGALVCLGDMPAIGSEWLQALVDAFVLAPDGTICVPTFEGKTGNPVLWPRQYFSHIMELEGDVGAKSLIGLHAAAVLEVEVETGAIFQDVDTPQALAALEKETSVKDF